LKYSRSILYKYLIEPLEKNSTKYKNSERKKQSEAEKMATNIGIMDAAYFVGRSEIISWINSTLQLNLSKVEEVSIFSDLILF
jgi:RP/EB family microtubule-associated protein